MGGPWHSHGKNPVRLYPKLQSQSIGLPKIFIDCLFFQAYNQIVENLYRFLIDLLPLKNVEMSFPTRGLDGLLTSEILRDTGKSRKAT